MNRVNNGKEYIPAYISERVLSSKYFFLKITKFKHTHTHIHTLSFSLLWNDFPQGRVQQWVIQYKVISLINIYTSNRTQIKTSIFSNILVYTYRHVARINEPKCYKFVREQEGLYGKLWKEGRKGRNVIILQSQNIYIKCAKMNIWFSKKPHNKYFKMCSQSLAIGEMQTKPTLGFHLTPTHTSNNSYYQKRRQ